MERYQVFEKCVLLVEGSFDGGKLVLGNLRVQTDLGLGACVHAQGRINIYKELANN